MNLNTRTSAEIVLACAFGVGIGMILATTYEWPIYLGAIIGGLVAGIASDPQKAWRLMRNPTVSFVRSPTFTKIQQTVVDFSGALLFMAYWILMVACVGANCMFLILCVQAFGFNIHVDLSQDIAVLGFLPIGMAIGAAICLLGGVPTLLVTAIQAIAYARMQKASVRLWIFPVAKLLGKAPWVLWHQILKNDQECRINQQEEEPWVMSWNVCWNVVWKWTMIFWSTVFGTPIALAITFGLLIPLLLLDVALTFCFMFASTKSIASFAGGFFGTLLGSASVMWGYIASTQSATLFGMIAGALCGLSVYWGRIATERLLADFAEKQRAYMLVYSQDE